MLFNSVEFLAFFTIVLFGYYSKALERLQVEWLIASSCIFYAWTNPLLLTLLVISVVFNATVSHYVVNPTSKQYRYRLVFLGVGINLLILGFFKYASLIAGSIISASGSNHFGWLASIPLPIGISFYTFEGISLIVDSYRDKRNPMLAANIRANSFRTHLKNSALFVTFFPHLIAGPILKANSFFPGIGAKRWSDIKWNATISALVTGYFLKTVVADNLASQTSYLSYPFYKLMSLSTALTMIFGYSIQIFSDFAGYSLIAIGLARLLGYELPQNFHYPYLASSLSDFWRRWHISLSSWLRDYLYIPLGGNKHGTVRTYLNLTIVMALGGMWHGAAWSYLIWGLYHGVGLAAERLMTSGKLREHEQSEGAMLWLKRVIIFVFVSVGWTFFKLPDFGQAVEFLTLAVKNWKGGPEVKRVVPILLYAMPIVLYYLHASKVQAHGGDQQASLLGRHRPLLLGIMLFFIIVNRGQSSEFIYFQF
jgi:alginate O-acetyltransferase complex protein AlgI